MSQFIFEEYYVFSSTWIAWQLHIVRDIAENPWDCGILRALYFQVQPRTLIVKAKQDEERMTVIQRLVGVEPTPIQSRPTDNDDDHERAEDCDAGNSAIEDDRGSSSQRELQSACKLRLLPAAFFSLESGFRPSEKILSFVS